MSRNTSRICSDDALFSKVVNANLRDAMYHLYAFNLHYAKIVAKICHQKTNNNKK